MRVRIATPVLFGLGCLLVAWPARGQDPPAPSENYEVLTRGPVHEAYAQPVDYQPEAGPVAPKAPPEPIEEVPPDQKPAGEDVVWIPGYWAWDGEEKGFLWVSGFWREAPPDRRWVPGTWQEAEDGWHWTAGFWAAEEAEAVEYTPPPPASIDAGPSTPAERETDIYIPGTWVWQQSRFAWRPGFWCEYRPDWVWAPAHYAWTPGGCVFVDGYWDRPLHLRGLLFAPMRPAVGAVAGFRYVPAYVVQPDFLMTAMFVGPARRHYFFGDYFEPAYQRRGFVAWNDYHPARRAPDPVFGYYRAAYHGRPGWAENLAAVYQARRAGTIPPPPRTLVQQQQVVTNITNNRTANVSVARNVNITNVQNVSVVAPLNRINNSELTALAGLAPVARKGAEPAAPARVLKLQQVDRTEREQQRQQIDQTRRLAGLRQQVEGRLIADSPPAKGRADTPRTAPRLDLPRTSTSAKPVKTDEPPAPPARPRPKVAAPPAPTVPKTVDREPPKDTADPPRRIRPPAARKKDPTPDPEPPAKKDPRPPVMPKKDRDDDPPGKKDPRPPVVPKKDREDDPPAKTPMPRPKDSPPVTPPKKVDPPRPKAPDPVPAPPKKVDPPAPPKKVDPPPVPKKADPPPKKNPSKKDD